MDPNLNPRKTRNDPILRTRRRGKALTPYSIDKPSSFCDDISMLSLCSEDVEDRVGESLMDRTLRASGREQTVVTRAEVEQDDLFDGDDDNCCSMEELIQSDIDGIKMGNSDPSEDNATETAAKLGRMATLVRREEEFGEESFVDVGIDEELAVTKIPPPSAFQDRERISSCKAKTKSPRHRKPVTKTDASHHPNLVSFFQWNRPISSVRDTKELGSYLEENRITSGEKDMDVSASHSTAASSCSAVQVPIAEPSDISSMTSVGSCTVSSDCTTGSKRLPYLGGYHAFSRKVSYRAAGRDRRRGRQPQA